MRVIGNRLRAEGYELVEYECDYPFPGRQCEMFVYEHPSGKQETHWRWLAC